MEFRPCIDIHNGKVKQIVGGSLNDGRNEARENFVSGQDASFYASFYKEKKLGGGHVVMLNAAASEYYEETKRQALLAFSAYPGGLQAGGGIRPENAAGFLEAGASHVIVTSYVFSGGRIHYGNLERLKRETGRDRLVLDLSCRRKGDAYYIATDRWQKLTHERVTLKLLRELAGSCAEFLIHAVDVEGKQQGIEEELAVMLGEFGEIPVTYAGGVGSLKDIQRLKKLGRDRVNVTVGSALDLFGGNLRLKEILSAVEGKPEPEERV